MVYLNEHIKKLKEGLDNNNLGGLAYFFVSDKEKLSLTDIDAFNGLDLIAAKGYLSIPLSDLEKDQILKPGYKGIDISTTIFKLLGAYLADTNGVENKLNAKFSETSLKNKFLISRVVPSFRKKFSDHLETEDSPEKVVFAFLEGANNLTTENAEQINTIIQTANDVIDLLILEELNKRFVESQINGFSFNSLTPHELILSILTNFHNASKKITQGRRKDHREFKIEDEYDVQDLLYTILKCIFPKLKEEDPTPKVGGKSNKIDLILREEGILIEVKMLKLSDTSDKPFIEQLKTDIQSYHSCEWLKHLVFFIYDPHGKSKDVHNFFDLEGTQSINGKAFTIKVILNPI